MKKIIVSACAVILSLSNVCFGQSTNVYWNFSTGGTTPPVTPLIGGLTASSFSRGNNNGAGVLLSQTSASSGYTTAAGFGASGTTNIGAAAFSGALNTLSSTFFEVSLTLDNTAAEDYYVTGVSFGTRQTGTGPLSLSLYSSADGFASDFNSLGSLSVANDSTWTASGYSSLFVLLPSDSTTISFRLYGADGNGGTATINWRVDDWAFTLTPASAVPEPSTLALASVAGAFLLALRRRR